MNVIKAAIILRFEAQMKTAARKTAAFPCQVLPSPLPLPPLSVYLGFDTKQWAYTCVCVCVHLLSLVVCVCVQ